MDEEFFRSFDLEKSFALLLITPILYYYCTLLCSSMVYDAVLGISLSMMKLRNGPRCKIGGVYLVIGST